MNLSVNVIMLAPVNRSTFYLLSRRGLAFGIKVLGFNKMEYWGFELRSRRHLVTQRNLGLVQGLKINKGYKDLDNRIFLSRCEMHDCKEGTKVSKQFFAPMIASVCCSQFYD